MTSTPVEARAGSPVDSPVTLRATAAPGQPDVTPELEELYRGFEAELLVPLWTEIGDLMPAHPRSRALPHRWTWERLVRLAEGAGRLVPVGRGGERRAIALANPGLGGRPFATPTLWAAIQYLMPGEDAPEHRHTQHAFRFVVEGSGVWTVVGGDPVPMNRGDFLPQAGWNWHAHHNATDRPMAWIDGLDIPFQYLAEAQFFEFGRDGISGAERITPERSRSERLWGHPGLSPVGARHTAPGSPLLSYKWEYTDRALADQLALEREGHAATVEPGHAAVRFSNPVDGADVLPTLRAEFHRVARGAETAPVRETGSSVFQVFDGSGTVTVGDRTWTVARGDLFVVPSWEPFSARSEAGASDSDSGALDLFRFSDAPVFEALRLHRTTKDSR
ncbi:cupin domain-containing protein [Actinomadura parmotrematis]|uniref:Cupin domain-containing protein n=1 Tax=Actinomadura parmotrematis TaxID=2864039 RepID=A0ABS7FUM6_9ACTN|nr:cupin domain-containing protein [Actinomadura parmotrematis]MBW8484115.1 cupin domain-containing protein [Actinomadura parmotrematis]